MAPSATLITTSSAMISQLLASPITTRVPVMMQLSARASAISPRLVCSTAPDATLHANAAVGIGGGAAHQVLVQHNITAAHDIPEHVAVDGDVPAFHRALLLHVAKLLVLAGELQVAGGARAHAFAADDLRPDRQPLGAGSRLRKPHRRHQEFAIAQVFNHRAFPGHRGQLDILGHRRLQHDSR
jgi:hypothetical protein